MKFSIIIPFYKYTGYLDKCLESCFNQTFTDFDIFLVDDGSPKSSEEEIKRILNKNVNDIPFSFHRLENGGAAAARNYASNLSKSDYLVFLDCDDLLHKDALLFYNMALNDDLNTVLTTKRFEFNNFIDTSVLNNNINLETCIVNRSKNYFTNRVYFKFGASNIIVPRNSFLRVDGFRLRSEKTWYAEDHDLLLKLGDLKFIFIEEPYLVYYRYHENNSIHNLEGIGYGVLELVYANQMKKYPGTKTYDIKKLEIIGSPVFHIVFRLIKAKKYRLALSILKQGYKYIYFFTKSKIGRNAKRKSI
ncbi:glycosyltransferase family A protein [Polaribacter staleyi]|uniref:glycosyltransferase family 2 protein n=1 Tax=Polaribacter staleyi TaxID=2022337 RepID=UPI0031BA2DEC